MAGKKRQHTSQNHGRSAKRAPTSPARRRAVSRNLGVQFQSPDRNHSGASGRSRSAAWTQATANHAFNTPDSEDSMGGDDGDSVQLEVQQDGEGQEMDTANGQTGHGTGSAARGGDQGMIIWKQPDGYNVVVVHLKARKVGNYLECLANFDDATTNNIIMIDDGAVDPFMGEYVTKYDITTSAWVRSVKYTDPRVSWFGNIATYWKYVKPLRKKTTIRNFQIAMSQKQSDVISVVNSNVHGTIRVGIDSRGKNELVQFGHTLKFDADTNAFNYDNRLRGYQVINPAHLRPLQPISTEGEPIFNFNTLMDIPQGPEGVFSKEVKYDGDFWILNKGINPVARTPTGYQAGTIFPVSSSLLSVTTAGQTGFDVISGDSTWKTTGIRQGVYNGEAGRNEGADTAWTNFGQSVHGEGDHLTCFWAKIPGVLKTADSTAYMSWDCEMEMDLAFMSGDPGCTWNNPISSSYTEVAQPMGPHHQEFATFSVADNLAIPLSRGKAPTR